MLDLIKDALRISSTDLDDELESYIDACALDLAHIGFSEEAITAANEIIENLTILYCKAMLNWREQGAAYMDAYKSMRDGFSMDGGYNGQESDAD